LLFTTEMRDSGRHEYARVGLTSRLEKAKHSLEILKLAFEVGLAAALLGGFLMFFWHGVFVRSIPDVDPASLATIYCVLVGAFVTFLILLASLSAAAPFMLIYGYRIDLRGLDLRPTLRYAFFLSAIETLPLYLYLLADRYRKYFLNPHEYFYWQWAFVFSLMFPFVIVVAYLKTFQNPWPYSIENFASREKKSSRRNEILYAQLWWLVFSLLYYGVVAPFIGSHSHILTSIFGASIFTFASNVVTSLALHAPAHLASKWFYIPALGVNVVLVSLFGVQQAFSVIGVGYIQCKRGTVLVKELAAGVLKERRLEVYVVRPPVSVPYVINNCDTEIVSKIGKEWVVKLFAFQGAVAKSNPILVTIPADSISYERDDRGPLGTLVQ